MFRHLGRSSVTRMGAVSFARPIRRKFSNNSSGFESILNTDGSKSINKFYHSSAYALAALTPIAFYLSPSRWNTPIDLTLGVLFPVHSHVALNCIVTDYVPKAIQSTARVGILGVTIVSILGLLRLNLGGAGMTESIKSLWRRRKEPKKVL